MVFLSKKFNLNRGLMAAVSVACISFSAITPAYAADAVKALVVDTQRIMKTSLAAQDAKRQLEDMGKKFHAEVQKQEDLLKKKDKELAGQRSVLSEKAFEEKRKEFKNQYMQAQRVVQADRAKLDDAYGNATSKIQDAVLGIVADIAKEKGADLVLPSNQILYSSPALDVTEEVKKRLDKKLPKVTIALDNKKTAAAPAKKDEKK